MNSQRAAVEQADQELLASLGYKQEFKRAFSALEVSTLGVGLACRRFPARELEDIKPCIDIGASHRHLELRLVSLAFSRQ